MLEPDAMEVMVVLNCRLEETLVLTTMEELRTFFFELAGNMDGVTRERLLKRRLPDFYLNAYHRSF